MTAAFSADQQQFDDLKARLESAIKAKDTKALSDCYYWEGTPQALIDQSIWSVEENWKINDYKNIKFSQLDDPGMNPRFLAALTEGRIMNGRQYAPNLKPEAVCTITFSKNGSTTGTSIAVGVAPDGKLKIVGTKVIEK
jgi:hypothetical protein